MSAPLEPWPELSDFIRELVRSEVDSAIGGLAAFVRREVNAAVGGLMDEIASTIERPEAKREPRARPSPPRRRSNSEWLTPKRAAKIAGVKPKTILTWVRGGQLRRYGTQHRVLVSRADLDRLLRRGGEPPQRRARLANGHAFAPNGHAS